MPPHCKSHSTTTAGLEEGGGVAACVARCALRALCVPSCQGPLPGQGWNLKQDQRLPPPPLPCRVSTMFNSAPNHRPARRIPVARPLGHPSWAACQCTVLVFCSPRRSPSHHQTPSLRRPPSAQHHAAADHRSAAWLNHRSHSLLPT